MKKISLFIAMSLDGYIADSKGSVEWLTGQGNDEDNIDSYSEFVKDIDTVVMGWNTYHQIVTELSPEDWVYDNLCSDTQAKKVFRQNPFCQQKPS